MKRLLLVAALGLGLSVCAAGVTRAGDFQVVPSTGDAVPAIVAASGSPTASAPVAGAAFSVAPASAAVPNDPTTLALPLNWTVPPPVPEQLPAQQLQALWQQAGAAYGIPWQVLGAINKIESNFGRNMGPSSAGAIGWMQFMPDTWLRWGTDANGDGVADPWSAEDAIYSAARYLAASGGAQDIAGAVFSYNHAQWYVDEVLQLAQLYATGGVQETFGVDQLQQRLADAEHAVVEKNRALVAAQLEEARISDREAAQVARSSAAVLISERLSAQKRSAQLDGLRAAAEEKVGQLQRELADAQAELAAARAAAQPASFDQAAGRLLAAPSYGSNYVFPVGGGPSVVSVSHHHHDYPAADIAAPEGTPVYALSDGTVVRSWSLPDARCGIGLTFQTTDGQTWTYCHLAYLEPGAVAGTTLPAGAPVGLVGQTGDATGPHLHLQLDPATSYPQDEAWFGSFAGRAFRWQDAPTPEISVTAAGPAATAAPTPAGSGVANPAAATEEVTPVFAPGVPHPVFAVVPTLAVPAGPQVIQFTRAAR